MFISRALKSKIKQHKVDTFNNLIKINIEEEGEKERRIAW